MNRVGGQSRLPSNARFTFWYHGSIKPESAAAHAGKSKIARQIEKSSALPGNLKAVICAGSLTEPYVTATFIKTGMKK
jgi:hypothetical protein